MYPDQRVRLQRRAALARRLIATQRAHALYGLESDDLESLGGWWSKTKRVASRTVRKTVPVLRKVGSIQGASLRAVRDADVPLFSTAAKLGLQTQDQYASVVSAVNRQTESKDTATPEETVTKKNLLIPVGIAAVAAFFLFKR